MLMYEYFIALYSEKKLYLARLIVFPALSADKPLFPICRLCPITYNFGKLWKKWPETFQHHSKTLGSSVKAVCVQPLSGFLHFDSLHLLQVHTSPSPVVTQALHTKEAAVGTNLQHQMKTAVSCRISSSYHRKQGVQWTV